MSRRSVFAVLILIGISLVFLATSGASQPTVDVIQSMEKEGQLAPADSCFYWLKMYEFGDGIWISLRLRLDHKTWYWPALWQDNPEGTSHQGNQWYEWYERGNMKFRRYILNNPGDYLSFSLVVEPGRSLVLDSGTKIVLFYEKREVESLELLVVDSLEESKVFRNSFEPLIFSENQTGYLRGGPIFMFAARFPDGVIGKKDPLDGSDFDRPIAFGMRKGGKLIVPDQFVHIVETEVKVSLGGGR